MGKRISQETKDKIVYYKDNENRSWVDIAKEFNLSPDGVRRIYQRETEKTKEVEESQIEEPQIKHSERGTIAGKAFSIFDNGGSAIAAVKELSIEPELAEEFYKKWDELIAEYDPEKTSFAEIKKLLERIEELRNFKEEMQDWHHTIVKGNALNCGRCDSKESRVLHCVIRYCDECEKPTLFGYEEDFSLIRVSARD